MLCKNAIHHHTSISCYTGTSTCTFHIAVRHTLCGLNTNKDTCAVCSFQWFVSYRRVPVLWLHIWYEQYFPVGFGDWRQGPSAQKVRPVLCVVLLSLEHNVTWPLCVSGTKQWYKSVFCDKYKVAHCNPFFFSLYLTVSCNETVQDLMVRKTISSLRKTVRHWAAGDQKKIGPEEAKLSVFFFSGCVWKVDWPAFLCHLRFWPSRPLQFLSINKNQNDGENTGIAERDFLNSVQASWMLLIEITHCSWIESVVWSGQWWMHDSWHWNYSGEESRTQSGVKKTHAQPM